MKNKIVKYGSRFIILYQLIAIVVSLINLIYDFATGKTAITFISYVSWFVPQYYISVTGNLWNLVPLILLIGTTIFLFVKSSKCLLSDNPMGYRYPAYNAIWLGLNVLSYMDFFCFHWSDFPSGKPPYFSISNTLSIVILFVYPVLIYLKYPLFEMFRENLSVTKYSKVKEYAITNSIIAVCFAVWNIWMHYFGDTSVSNPKHVSMFQGDMIMFIYVMISVAIFFVTLYYYFHVKKLNSDIIPCKHFLLKINILQISAIILEAGVILLNAFVFF